MVAGFFSATTLLFFPGLLLLVLAGFGGDDELFSGASSGIDTDHTDAI